MFTYENIVEGRFISRPNRFIGHVEIDGKEEICHVKTTGRCREILLPGAECYLNYVDKPLRKTKYDLISVYKGDKLINIDSQVPNHIFEKWILRSGYFGKVQKIKREATYRHSRFDFYIEAENRKIYAEIKGVTLEENGVVSFPGAPTERGIKHLNDLLAAKEEGFEAMAVFIAQMKGVNRFEPNDEIHKTFGDTLRRVHKKGVDILALDCSVTRDSITIGDLIDIKL